MKIFLNEKDKIILWMLINLVISTLFYIELSVKLFAIWILINLILGVILLRNSTSHLRKKKLIIIILFLSLLKINVWNNLNSKDLIITNQLKKEISLEVKIKESVNVGIESKYWSLNITHNKNLFTQFSENVYLLKKNWLKINDNESFRIKFMSNSIVQGNNGIFINQYILNKIENTKFFYKDKSLRKKLDKFLVDEHNCLSWSILTGNKNVLPENIKDIFIKTGTAHLFAVSGLHLGFIYLLIRLLFFWVNDSFIKIVLVLSSCYFYIYLVGYPDSAVRAFLMISFVELSIFFRIRSKLVYALCWTIIIVVLINWRSILSIGFQLSFTIVLFLIYSLSSNVIKQQKYKALGIINNYIILCVSASCGSYLLIFDYFQYISLTSVFTNLLICPVIFLFFVLSLANLFLYFIFQSNILFIFIDLIYNYIFNIVFMFSKIEPFEFFHLEVFRLNSFVHLFVFFLVLVLHFINPPRKFRVISTFFYYFLITFTSFIFLS